LYRADATPWSTPSCLHTTRLSFYSHAAATQFRPLSLHDALPISGLLLRQIGLGSSWGPAKRFSSAAGPHFAAGFTRPGRAAAKPSPLPPPASPPPHAPPRRCALPPAPARR